MIKIFKNLPAFVLFVAGLAIMAHSIIPHDHHIIDIYEGREDTCPESTDNSSHHPLFPIHCHVCNDLTSEKAAPLIIILNLPGSFFITENANVLPGKKSGIFEALRTDASSLISTSYNSEFYLLRAPPLV